MIDPHTERRLAENEMVFREYNERIQRGFDELSHLAQQEGKKELVFDDDMPLHFYCECSDENCDKRIEIEPSIYRQIHEKRDRFMAKKGHEVPEIEKVISQKDSYAVIEKLNEPPKWPISLHASDIDNG
jgi:hypothetical protein